MENNPLHFSSLWSPQFRKCVVQLFRCSDVTVIEGNINQTTERAGMTNESNTGEMSTIAARIPAAGTVPPKTEEHPSERRSLGKIPIPENKVCPMWRYAPTSLSLVLNAFLLLKAGIQH